MEKKEAIVDEIKMFFLEQSKEMGDISNLIYCTKCNDFSHSKYKENGWFSKKGYWHCKECNSKSYLAWYKVEDRKQILEIFRAPDLFQTKLS